jgi:hypothetical protein
MSEKKEVLHQTFSSTQEVNNYYDNHPMIRELGEDWGSIRVEYPEGHHDGFYVFTAISKKTHCEVDIPRALLSIANCSRDERDFIEKFLFVILQPDGPVFPIKGATHVEYDTYQEVKDHFKSNPECMNEEDTEILRFDSVEHPVHPDYAGCHVFLAINMITGMEMDVPRAIIKKNMCSEDEDDEIQQIPYFDELDEFYKDEILVIPEKSPPEAQPRHSSKLTPDRPGDGDKIN